MAGVGYELHIYGQVQRRQEKRMRAHNAGRGARYTKSRLPVTLEYYEVFETKEEAMRRECAIKRMTRAQKLALLAERSR